MEAVIAMIAGLWIFLLIIVIFLIACNWKIYSKAGQPGWACIIPIYSTIVLLKIIKKPLWWFLLLMIPFVNFIIILIMRIQLAKVFGKGAGFGIGIILLPIIFIPMLAFGSAQYQSDDAAPAEA